MKTIDLREKDSVLKVQHEDSLPPLKPYNEMEFEEFLNIISGGGTLAQATWQDVAKALQVDPRTIQRWKLHPRALEAKEKALQEHIKILKEHTYDDPKSNKEVLRKLGYEIGNDDKPLIGVSGDLNINLTNYSQNDPKDKPKVIDADNDSPQL